MSFIYKDREWQDWWLWPLSSRVSSLVSWVLVRPQPSLSPGLSAAWPSGKIVLTKMPMDPINMGEYFAENQEKRRFEQKIARKLTNPDLFLAVFAHLDDYANIAMF